MGEFGLIFSRIQSLHVHAPLRIHYEQICKKKMVEGFGCTCALGWVERVGSSWGVWVKFRKCEPVLLLNLDIFLQILVKGLNTLQSAIASKICEYPWNWVSVVLG